MTLVFNSGPARLRMEAAGRAFAARAGDPGRREIAKRAKEALMADEAWAAEKRLRDALRPPMVAILQDVSARHGLTTAAVRGARRAVELIAARHECFWLCREQLGYSYPKIARFFRRDHTTVIHGCRKHAALIEAGEVPFS